MRTLLSLALVLAMPFPAFAAGMTARHPHKMADRATRRSITETADSQVQNLESLRNRYKKDLKPMIKASSSSSAAASVSSAASTNMMQLNSRQLRHSKGLFLDSSSSASSTSSAASAASTSTGGSTSSVGN